MTFYQNVGLYFISDSNIPTHLWIRNDSMYVRFGGIRNTKTWSKSRVRKQCSYSGAMNSAIMYKPCLKALLFELD